MLLHHWVRRVSLVGGMWCHDFLSIGGVGCHALLSVCWSDVSLVGGVGCHALLSVCYSEVSLVGGVGCHCFISFRTLRAMLVVGMWYHGFINSLGFKCFACSRNVVSWFHQLTWLNMFSMWKGYGVTPTNPSLGFRSLTRLHLYSWLWYHSFRNGLASTVSLLPATACPLMLFHEILCLSMPHLLCTALYLL
jgi:hypothetical protein